MLAYPWLRLEPPVATLLRYDVTLPRHLLHHVAAPFFLCPLAVVRPRFLSPSAPPQSDGGQPVLVHV